MTSSIRVGFNARLLADPSLRGWNRYSVNLLANLPQFGIRPVLYSNNLLHPIHLARFLDGTYETIVGGPRNVIAWEQWWLPRRCSADGIHILHSTFNFGLPRLCGIPRILTLHDAIDDAYRPMRTSWWKKWTKSALISSFMHRTSRRVADQIITVSEYSRDDIVRWYAIKPERITVTFEAADPTFTPQFATEVAQILDRNGIRRPYVFYVGGWERRKNIPFLLRSFAAARLNNMSLVLAGGCDTERRMLTDLADELGIRQCLHLLGWVEDAILPALYAGATCFVYPSEYEGFGLQLVEAMSVGCPVFAAKATSLPEVLGKGGETFALDGTDELTGLLRHISADTTFQTSLAERAIARSKNFSWKRTAAETAVVYREVLKRLKQ